MCRVDVSNSFTIRNINKNQLHISDNTCIWWSTKWLIDTRYSIKISIHKNLPFHWVMNISQNKLFD